MPAVIGQFDGQDVREAVLESAEARVSILNYGCVIRDWRVEAFGRAVPCVLGFSEFAPYPVHSKSFGIIAGRVANRIGGASFELGGQRYDLKANEGANILHGGPKGLGSVVWDMEMSGPNTVILRYVSPDGEMGFPGRVEFEVVFRLLGLELVCEMRGVPDRPTPINLAQHNYYNLNGGGDVLGHVLEIAADLYTPVDEALIPTGELLPVGGTHLDFRTPVLIGERDLQRQGIDHNLVLASGDARKLDEPVASLWSEDTGLELQLFSDQPGLQLFNAPTMEIPVPGHDGASYGAFGGVCLEPQGFPDAVNRPEFPDVVATPEKPYFQRLGMRIAPV
ncbi:aldose epimerase family protein [Algicella marina]|uniref:Aldose 1-epimerase n=1 Tax=Algicella marina TaxID=2683284 RepID=A0A6P1SZC5_9RHOB|nr:aldose epimerase family protein [Algicella marina]QHQ34970.1 galactose mutarotase [Algicella marina]